MSPMSVKVALQFSLGASAAWVALAEIHACEIPADKLQDGWNGCRITPPRFKYDGAGVSQEGHMAASLHFQTRSLLRTNVALSRKSYGTK